MVAVPDPPLVSLIMTVHNRDRYLPVAIESVLVQTNPNFELILWNDGSTDRSLELMQHYAQQDDRIRLFSTQHQGRAQALKAAHAEVRGQYIGWIDSDDVLSPIALEKTVPILERSPEIGLVYTHYRVIDEYNRVYEVSDRCSIPYSREQMLVDFLTFHFRLMRRSLYEQVGGIDVSFPCAMDYDLCLKLSEVTEVHHLEQVLYYYRTHADSISMQRRLEQIQYSQRAVMNAIERRGLAQELELEVEVQARFSIVRKPTTLTVQDAVTPPIQLIA